MKLDPPPKRKMRVHALAKERGWSTAQPIAEHCRRGKYVKSLISTIEALVARDLP
jgi:hypothetical protein